MGSVDPAISGGKKDKSTCTILVTGFGPFQDRYPVNPSFQIARLLPSTLHPPATSKTKIQILTHPDPVRVAYADVSSLVPALLDSYAHTIDLVLHIGMASNRSYYAAERLAHRDGYDAHPDVDGVKLPPNFGREEFADCGDEIETGLPCDEVVRRWRRDVGGEEGGCLDVRESRDPGRYLCDFIYYNSLAWYERRSRESGGEGRVVGRKDVEKPVMFLHVPPESDAVSLKTGVKAAEGLIRAMASCWREDGESGEHEDL